MPLPLPRTPLEELERTNPDQRKEKQPFPAASQALQEQTLPLSFQPDEMIGDRYRVISHVAQGGMGSVYKVEQVFLKKHFALKTLGSKSVSKESWRRFQKEAKAAALLDHPTLIRVQDFGLIHDEQPFFVMDFVEGETLANIIKKGHLPLDMVLEIFRQVCSGLAYAHDLGVIHRDIKPSNIMISNAQDLNEMKVKIVDFGIAKIMGMDEEEHALTQTGDVFGTPYYMSPEQCLGKTLDDRSDIYSVGCVLFEALTGLPPFVGETSLAIMLRHQGEKPPSLREASLGTSFPTDLELVVAKLLEKAPRDRYQSLTDVAADLNRIKLGQPIELGRLSSTGGAQKQQSSPVIYLVLAGVAVICLCIAAFFAGRLTSPRPTVTIEHPETHSDSELTAVQVQEHLADAATLPDNDKTYFSTQLGSHSNWRLFHFPTDSLGRIENLPTNSKMYAYTNGQFVEPRIKDAKGEILVENFQGLRLQVDPELTQNAVQFERFRPDDLVYLDFTGNLGVNAGVLKHIRHLTGLRGLSFDEINSLKDDVVEEINQLPNLEELVISHSGLSAKSAAKIKRLRELRLLRMRSVRPADLVLEKMEGSKNIRELNLRRTHLTPKTFQILATMPNLERLDISGDDQLNDEDVHMLLKLPKLHSLSLEDTRSLTPKCIQYLKAMPLDYLTMEPNKWPPIYMRQLKQVLPHCQFSTIEHAGSSLQRIVQDKLTD